MSENVAAIGDPAGGTDGRRVGSGYSADAAATRRRVQALVLDLDNTLYDWVSYFVPAISAMLDCAAPMLGVDVGTLREQIRVVHRKHGNTEHPFALLETEIVAVRFLGRTDRERCRRLRRAFKAFDDVRDDKLELYPGVAATLDLIRASGCRVFGYTEATETNIKARVRRLELVDRLEGIYAPQFTGRAHPLGPPSRFARASRWLADRARGRRGRGRVPIHRLPAGSKKPNVEVVQRIVDGIGVPRGRCLYVGDSLPRDVEMARRAGLLAAWAEYGCDHDPQDLAMLDLISHRGPEADAVRASYAVAAELAPDVVRLTSFGQLLDHFEFGPPDDVDGVSQGG